MERPIHIGCLWRDGGERISESKPRPLDTCPPRPPTVRAFLGLSQEEEQSGARADFLYSLRLTLGDLLFDFIGPLAFMRVICKAWGFNVQHQKANSCVRKCHRD